MAAYTWPLGLPQVPEKGYSESIGVKVSRNSMDSGATKLRTKGVRPDEVSLSYFMTLEQLETLDAFINNTLRVTAPFNFPHARRKAYTIVPLAVGSYDIPREQLHSVVSPAGTYINDRGVLEYASANEPRFTSDLLLVEPSFTNVVLDSNNFAAWAGGISGTGVAPIVTPYNAAGPDGVENSASTVLLNRGVGTTAGDTSILYSNLSIPLGQPTSAALWVRSVLPGAIHTLSLDFGGAVSTAPYNSVITVTNIWTRFKIVLANTTVSTNRISLRLRGNYGFTNTTQVEVFNGSQFLNTTNIYSDIITPVGATATRTADTVSYKSYLSTPEIVEARLLVGSDGKTYSIQELSPNYFRVSLKIEILP